MSTGLRWLIVFGLLLGAVALVSYLNRPEEAPEASHSLMEKSEELCGLYNSPEGRKTFARDLGADSTSTSDLVLAYASQFRQEVQQEAIIGCSKGFR